MKLMCPNCNVQYESGKFCPECGTKLQEVVPELVCPSCGYKAKSGKFCPECGTKLTEQIVTPKVTGKQEPVKPTFNEKDPRFAKYYDKKGFPRTIPQEERAVAIEELTPYANQNIAEAKMLLGNVLTSNYSDKDVFVKGMRLIKEAEQDGDKFAYYFMSIGYVFGMGDIVEQNHNEAERRLLEAFNDYQNVEFAGLLANLYTYSTVKCDYKKAFDYATIAAEDDDCGGYSVLGALYLNGWGVEKNVNLALENYKMAAAFGDADSMNKMGLIYSDDDNSNSSPEQAFYWFNEAAKKKCPDGMYNLGCCYKNGFGVEADAEQAAEWFKKAAELGYLDAMCELGEYYQETLVDFNKAKMWFLKAAELGYADAQNQLGVFYHEREDYNEAVKWYKKAMEQDDSWAYLNYAFCLWNGNGVKENKKKAMDMMQKAISLGNPDAESELKEMQQSISEKKKEETKVLESQPKSKQIKEKTEDIIIKNVKFSTDGSKTLFVVFECEYNQTYNAYEIYFTAYINNKDIPEAMEACGCGSRLSKKREKFCFKIPDYQLKMTTNKINNISFLIEARHLDEKWDGTQNPRIFPLMASYKTKLKLYYESHVFRKNVMIIK